MGPNTTGLPQTKDYLMGRGIIYIAPLDANGKPTAYRDCGNSNDFKLTVESETLEHKSSRSGLKIVDKEVVLSQKCTATFSLDECNNENLADFFSGSKATHTNVSVAGFAEHVMVADGNLALGRWYDIIDNTGSRAYDVDASKLTVKTNEAVKVTLAENTDYTVDTVMGRVFILSTSTKAATAITAGKGLAVTLTADAGAKAVNEVQALTTTAVKCALKFIGANPADNDKAYELQFHQVNLKANGDFSLISDDYTNMPFQAAAEANTAADADSPTLTIRVVAD